MMFGGVFLYAPTIAALATLCGHPLPTDEWKGSSQVIQELAKTWTDSALIMSRIRTVAMTSDRSRAIVERTFDGVEEKSEWWLSDSRLDEPLKLLLTFRRPFGGVSKPRFQEPQFSADGQHLLFLLNTSDTSFSLIRMNVATLQWSVVSKRVTDYCILVTGVRSGQIVAGLRKSLIVGMWHWYWLLEPDGKEVGPIGPEERLDEFFEIFAP